jgi:Domain of unknown function (DUF4333)
VRGKLRFRCLRSRALAAPLAAAALIAAGCGGTVVEGSGVEVLVAEELERTAKGKVTVDCPSDIAVDPGTTFHCDVRVDGRRQIATLKIRDSKADISLIDVSPAKTSPDE